MKFILMCGGKYKDFKIPKQLSIVKGERIVDRTIRLLKENGVKEIYISSNNPLFDSCDAIRLENKENNFTQKEKETIGYWLDAFYPINEEVCYIFGDVYFTEEAIKTIVNYKTDKNILFGTSDALNKYHNNWGEPFAYIVKDYKTFFKGIKEVKTMYDKGLIKRHPIVWELYRYLHNTDINTQRIVGDYICIDDGTIDIDNPKQVEELNRK